MSSDPNVVQMDSASHRLREQFLRWQCLVRQIAMRKAVGQPSEAMRPVVVLGDGEPPLSRIVTILSKLPEFSKTMELQHMVRCTQDPAQRREAALKFFAEGYYQAALEFSDTLTATFAPSSNLATHLLDARECTLEFKQFNQGYTLRCRVFKVSSNNPLYSATFWHNYLFNPSLSSDIMILGFEPRWSKAICHGS